MHLRQFIEKVSLLESKKTKDMILSISEARFMRDEIIKLLMDLHEQGKKTRQDPVQIEIKGQTFK